MTDTFDLYELQERQPSEGNPWLPFLDVPTLTAGLYTVREDDSATHNPHSRDEVYYVVGGRGVLRVEGEDRPVGPGTVTFVPAGKPHHFREIEGELVLLVFFSNAPTAVDA